ncbi:fumarylacetoacetate hydrolase family protein [soil metagenome]
MEDRTRAHPALGLFAQRGSNDRFVGVVLPGDRVLAWSDVASGDSTASARDVGDLTDDWDAASRVLDRIDRGSSFTEAFKHVDLDRLDVYAPIARPRQVICIGANYRKHVIDLVVAQGAGADTEGMTVDERRAHVAARTDKRAREGIPYAFPKLNGSVCGPHDDIVVPRDAEQFDWELELGVVIAKPAWRVPRSTALGVIAGYLIVNDLTRRELVYRSDLKSLGSDWLRAKSGPGFMPTGPLIVPARYVPDPQALHLRLTLNGKVMQDESTSDMLFDVARQIEYLSSYVRLGPGDIIATGSPAGNGMHHGRFLKPGDLLESTITGDGVDLGRQSARCVAEVV